ncbi:MAG: tetratricopeptide repeat protein [Planctomycetota bacterium]
MACSRSISSALRDASGWCRAHYGCSITSLLRWLDAGSPVIVLRKVGAWPWQTYHYQIIDGYDATRELLVLKDARDAGAVISFAELASTWPSRYALVLLREVDIELAARAAHAQAQGRLEDAARCYRAHLDRFPADLEAAYNLAGVELALGHVATAQQRYAAILALYPDDAPTANNLADSLCAHHGDLDQAEILARHALEVDPRNGCYYRATLGEVLRARGAPVEALNELQVALADPRNTDAELRRHLDGLIAELRDATRP